MSKNLKSTEKKAESWGKQLNPIFRFTEWIHKYRIYRGWKIFPVLSIKIYGRIFGTLYIHYIQRSYRKIISSLEALLPEKSRKELNKIYKSSIAYMGQFLLQMIFRLPLLSIEFTKKHTTYRNLDLIDKALEEGKGVIIPALHIGSVFEFLGGGLIFHEKKYNTCAVVSATNIPLIQVILDRPDASNAIAIDSTDFAAIRDDVTNHLRKNRIVVIMYDYTRESQFRVPFWEGKYDYLQHTPQSVIKLHKSSEAPIVPAVIHPKGEIGTALLEFLDNTKLMELSKKYWDQSSNLFHGMISTELNKMLNPYLRIYPHLWEEIANFGKFRIADVIKFKAGINLNEFLVQIQEKMISVLDNSFEPDRKDEKLLNIINIKFKFIIDSLDDPNIVLREHKTKIDLSKMKGVDELLKLCLVGSKELNEKNQISSAELMRELKREIIKVSS